MEVFVLLIGFSGLALVLLFLTVAALHAGFMNQARRQFRRERRQRLKAIRTGTATKMDWIEQGLEVLGDLHETMGQ